MVTFVVKGGGASRAVGVVSRTVVTFVVKLCLEALVAVWCVALSTCGGLLWRVLPITRVVSAVGATVLHLAEFWCLWWHPLLVLEWFVFVPSGALVHCVALWEAPGACVSTVCCVVFPDRELRALFHKLLGVALSVVRQALVVCLWSRCFSFLRLRSRCVSLSDHEADLGTPLWQGHGVDYREVVVRLSGPLAPVVFSDRVGCRDTRQKATSNLSLSGSDRLVVAFPSAVCFQFRLWRRMARVQVGLLACFGVRPSDAERDGSICRVQIRRRHSGHRDLVATVFSFARCSALEGLSTRQVVSVTWYPQPHASVRGSSLSGGRAQVLFRCGPASSSHCLTLRWLRSRIGRLGVGPQLGRAAVVCGCVLCYDSLASLYLGRSKAGVSGWRVRGVDFYMVGSLAVFSDFHSVGSLGVPNYWFGNPFLGAVRGGTGVCSSLTSWRVQGPGWFCLWALDLQEVEVAVTSGETSFSLGCLVSLGVTPGCSFPTLRRSEMLVLVSVVLLPLVGVPAALAGRDSLSQEFVAGRSWWRFVAPFIASSVSCERERL
ncbi:hypothetical protein Taro_052817 [Colocasia esculenta]|uniref:Uncharacterized protein n=1 Tax=Colocasia esculenta TaxID=4460 RepID=A0A843XKD3_COLES|nr:hypothetical protein [Colocasia esculenta]